MTQKGVGKRERERERERERARVFQNRYFFHFEDRCDKKTPRHPRPETIYFIIKQFLYFFNLYR